MMFAPFSGASLSRQDAVMQQLFRLLNDVFKDKTMVSMLVMRFYLACPPAMLMNINERNDVMQSMKGMWVLLYT